MTDHHPYVPALRFRRLTRWYDPVRRVALKEDRFKALLVAQAGLAPRQRVLDLGCGTATLTMMLKRACPGAAVVGLDGDPGVLSIARTKVAAAGLDIALRAGMVFAPPFAPASFDRIVSSLLFHHLATEDKRRTLAARDLLRPDSELPIADWGRPQNGFMRLAFLGVQLLDGPATTGDNAHRSHPVPVGGRLRRRRRHPPRHDPRRDARALQGGETVGRLMARSRRDDAPGHDDDRGSRGQHERMEDMALGRWTYWKATAFAVGLGTLALLVAGIPTDVVPNPWFTRMTPVRPQDYFFLGLTALLAAALGATYARPASCPLQEGKLTAGGFLSVLAIGCPICNHVVVLLLGVGGALTYFAPLQPVLGLASLTTLGIALSLRLRAIRTRPRPVVGDTAGVA